MMQLSCHKEGIMKNKAKFALAGLMLALALTVAPQKAAADPELSDSYEVSNPGSQEYTAFVTIVSSILSAFGSIL
jgi:hypothetical protein